MSIEIRDFTRFDIAVSPAGASSGDFGILGFLTTEDVLSPAIRSKAYTSLTEIGADFATSTEVYKAATAFYGQTPQPRDFVVLTQYTAAQPAQLVLPALDLDAVLAISSGELTITVDGVEKALTGLDFSSGSTLADVASVLDTALTGAKAAVVTGSVVISSDTTGTGSTMTFGTGADSEALGAQQHQAVLLATGLAAETPVAALAANVALGAEFVGLDIHKDLRDNVGSTDGERTLDIASWANASKKIFGNTSNNLGVLNPLITTDTFSVTKNAALGYTLNTFSKNANLYPSSAVFGRAASVNFSGTNTTITVNLKQMAGVVAEDLSSAEFTALKDKNGSAVVQIGKDIVAYTNGKMANGSWLDSVHGRLWLENRCEVDMFNFIYTDPDKVPFTQEGLNQAEATLERSLLAAKRNGLIGSGYLSDGTYLPLGYRITAVPIADVPTSDKGNRLYAGLSFDVVGAGALHEVIGSGNFVE